MYSSYSSHKYFKIFTETETSSGSVERVNIPFWFCLLAVAQTIDIFLGEAGKCVESIGRPLVIVVRRGVSQKAIQKLLNDAAELELSIRSESRMSGRHVLREIDEGPAVTSASVHSWTVASVKVSASVGVEVSAIHTYPSCRPPI